MARRRGSTRLAPEVPGYHLRGQLAQGDASTFHRAEAVGHPGRLLVVKHLAIGHDTALLAATMRAMERRRGIDHPHLLPLLEIVPTETGLALVLPFATGGSLTDALAQAPDGLPATSVAAIGARIAAAIAALHACGFVHGDITPRAVLFDAEGRPLLGGLGPHHRGRPRSAKPGPVARSATCLGPARDAGGAPDAAGDVVGLGTTLYEGLHGQQPIAAGASPKGPRTAGAGGRHRPLSDLVDAPRSLTDAITSAMATDAANRPPTAAHLAELLGQASRCGQAGRVGQQGQAGQDPTIAKAGLTMSAGERSEPAARRRSRTTAGSPSVRTGPGTTSLRVPEERRPRSAVTLVAAAFGVLILGLVSVLATGQERDDQGTPTALTSPAPRPTAGDGVPPAAPSGSDRQPGPQAAEPSPPTSPLLPPRACDPRDPPGGTGELLLADLDGRGCPTPVRWDGTELTIAVIGDTVRRFTLDAEPDDQLLFADLSCQGRDAPVLYRPETGEVFAFDGLVAPGEEVTVTGQPSGAIGGNASVVPGDGGCDTIAVVDPR